MVRHRSISYFILGGNRKTKDSVPGRLEPKISKPMRGKIAIMIIRSKDEGWTVEGEGRGKRPTPHASLRHLYSARHRMRISSKVQSPAFRLPQHAKAWTLSFIRNFHFIPRAVYLRSTAEGPSGARGSQIAGRGAGCRIRDRLSDTRARENAPCMLAPGTRTRARSRQAPYGFWL